jgi:hypothetical protein
MACHPPVLLCLSEDANQPGSIAGHGDGKIAEGAEFKEFAAKLGR